MERPVVDPFGAPAGTTLRFWSLILLAAGATASWYDLFSNIWHPAEGSPNFRCMVRSGYYPPMGVWLSPADQAKYDQYHRCIQSTVPRSALWVVGSLVLLTLVALLLFALQPGWLRHRRRLVPVQELPSSDSAALRAELEALVGVAGLARAPAFLIDPANARPAGRAFGGLGLPQVALSAGLVVQLRHAPHKFRAVVLHELAHIRNSDVTLTYVTVAVWRAFVLVTVLPALANLLDPALATTHPGFNPYRAGFALTVHQLVTEGWLFLVITALVYLSRTAVLRAREGYADARAAQWLDPGVLREALAASADRDGTRWWHTHPRRLTRLRLLDRPEFLLQPGFWESFTAGFAVQFAGTYAYLAAVSLWDPRAGSIAEQGPHDTATLATALALAIAAWRGAAFVRSGTGRRSSYTRAGLGLGFGLAAAFALISLYEGVTQRNLSAQGALTWAHLQGDLLFAALMVGSVLVLCHWAGYCAQVMDKPTRSPRGLLVLVAVVVATWACLRWWNLYGALPLADTLAGDAALWHQSVRQAHWTALDPLVVKSVLYPFVLRGLLGQVTMLAAPLLWLLPLLLGAPRHHALRSATRTGALAALTWLLLDAGLRLAAHLTVPSGTRAGDGFAVVFVCWEIATVLTVQTGTALLLGARRARLMPSLFATTLTGLLCCLALWAVHLTSACRPGPGFSASRCYSNGDVFVAFEALQLVGVLGSVLAVGAVLLGRALRRTPRPPGPGQHPAARRFPTARTQLALTALASAFIAVTVSSPPRHEKVDSVGVGYLPARIDQAEVARESYPFWLEGGGSAHVYENAGAYVALFRAMAPLQHRRLGWAAISQDAHVLAACQALSADGARTDAFPPPPEQKAAAHWAAYVQVLDRSVDDCTTATTSSDPATEATHMNNAVTFSLAPQNAVVADEAAAMKRVGG